MSVEIETIPYVKETSMEEVFLDDEPESKVTFSQGYVQVDNEHDLKAEQIDAHNEFIEEDEEQTEIAQTTETMEEFTNHEEITESFGMDEFEPEPEQNENDEMNENDFDNKFQYTDEEDDVHSPTKDGNESISELSEDSNKKQQKLNGTNFRRQASYRCVDCLKRFVHKHTYEAHMQQVHQGSSRPYACTECDKTYKTSSAVKYHILIAHKSDETPFPCPTCG